MFLPDDCYLRELKTWYPYRNKNGIQNFLSRRYIKLTENRSHETHTVGRLKTRGNRHYSSVDIQSDPREGYITQLKGNDKSSKREAESC